MLSLLSRLTARGWFALIAAACFAALAFALTAQHAFGMRPCAWCVLQRLIYLAIGIVALFGVVIDKRPTRGLIVLVLLALVASGVAAALWQNLVAASADSCDLTLAERVISAVKLDEWLPEVFTAWASCKDAAVTLLGVAFELWSLVLYLMLGGAALMALRALRG